MTLVLLIGGARSGKSALALRLAQEQRSSVVFLATAQAGDAEMTQRIAQHARERPAAWKTIEEPLQLRDAIDSVGPEECLVIDCLTLWTSNALNAFTAAQIEADAAAAAGAAAARPGLTVVVTNEVGLGIVPDNQLARTYRDLLGRVNSIWAQAADHVYLLVAGRALALASAESISEPLP
jgi:adenosylcobinamide kinase / adenosylcobinamide-phosphate guanylyltransferase